MLDVRLKPLRAELCASRVQNVVIARKHSSKRNDFPKDIRLQCWNCNVGRSKNGGKCPHDC